MYKDKEKQKEANRQAQARYRAKGNTEDCTGSREGHVYVAQCGDMPYYKVGVTQGQSSRRISELQTGCPFKLNLIEVFFAYNATGLEQTIKDAFKENNVRGEWYLLDKLRLETLLRLFTGDTVSVFENPEERLIHEMNEHRPKQRPY